jgi:hypothetical protein
VELVSLPEAAQRLGVSVDTVKRRLRRGELKGRQEPRPQGYTWLIEVPDNNSGSTADSNATSMADLDSGTVEVLNLREMLTMAQAQITVQQEQLAMKDQQLETKDRQIEQLHVLLQQAQAALPAPRENRRSWWRFWGR